jgi:hypothetical protein
MKGSANVTFFPSQKKATSQKNEKWMKDCMDAAENFTVFKDNRIRQSQYNKKINYDLYNDILDQRDMQSVCNPLNLQNATFPAKMQNYPIANPKIDLLIGEEFKRKFEWRVRSVNDSAISEKENYKKERIMNLLMQQIQGDAMNEQDLQNELRRLNKYLNYEYQDLRELNATRILTYLYNEQDLKLKFNQGFTDALIAGEEIYCADIVSGEPILRRVNPLNLFTIRSGDSHHIEDSDIIVEYSYEPVGKVIDFYYEYLTDKQIDDIEAGSELNTAANSVLAHKGYNPVFDIGDFVRQNGNGGLIEVNDSATRYFGGSYDEEGNIKVVRTVWKSRRKVGKLKYYDADGDAQEEIVDERYKPNVDKGEEIEWIWVNEWWEGTKIGEDIYVKMQPRPIQFRKMTNPSYCAPGYVGTLYATNDSSVKSLMDRMKPYQYLYNVFMYRTELAFAKSKGKIAQLDLSLVPDEWEVEKWLYYAEVLGWAPVDYFKVGNKGAATGKLRGNMTGASGHQVLDLELGSYIQQHIGMLSYLENQLGEIAGVTKQRQGQVSSSELVGNVERAVVQSSHITEKWFSAHDNTKLRAMATLLETAKFAWRNKNKKLQYVTDDLTTVMFEVDGKIFNESEYGLFMSSSTNDAALEQSLKQLAHAGIQNDKLKWSQLMDIYYSDSITSIRRKIEQGEQEQLEQQQQQVQQQQQHEQQMQQMQQQAQERALEIATADREDRQIHEKELKMMDNNTKLEVAYINSADKEFDRDQNNNRIPDDIELQKLMQMQQKIDNDYNLKQQKLQQDNQKIQNDKEMKEKDLKLKEKALNKKESSSK